MMLHVYKDDYDLKYVSQVIKLLFKKENYDLFLSGKVGNIVKVLMKIR